MALDQSAHFPGSRERPPAARARPCGKEPRNCWSAPCARFKAQSVSKSGSSS